METTATGIPFIQAAAAFAPDQSGGHRASVRSRLGSLVSGLSTTAHGTTSSSVPEACHVDGMVVPAADQTVRLADG